MSDTRKILFALTLWMLAVTCPGAKHALLVGINTYGAASGWRKIHGAEDVRLFEPLLVREGFSVKTLTGREATKKNVVEQISYIIDNAKVGDEVYLHFSCHGQPVEDLNHDEDDGWDEALVLYGAYKNYGDHGYKGENHLVDDELSQYMMQLRSKLGKEGFLYVIIDACHSGTSSRADRHVRGTNKGFCFTGNKPYTVDKHKGQPQYYKLARKDNSCGVVILEACRAWEVNHEITIDASHSPLAAEMKVGDKYGALSYHIYGQLTDAAITKDLEWVARVKKSMDADKTLKRQKMVIEYTEGYTIEP